MTLLTDSLGLVFDSRTAAAEKLAYLADSSPMGDSRSSVQILIGPGDTKYAMHQEKIG